MADFIVPTNVSYCYSTLISNINSLIETYPFLSHSSIGETVLGRSIPLLKFGNGTNTVFYNASFHANEWITSVLLMKFIENLCQAYQQNSIIYGYSARFLWDNTTLYIAPMVNPDGVDLVTGGLKDSPFYEQAKLIGSHYPSIPFPSGWKANITGVDLNLQFPARLGDG